jgi:hypothetical protein
MATLEGTRLVDARHLASYEEIGETREQVLAAVQRYDLLILDVHVPEGNAESFMRFVNLIAQSKPYLAYTWLSQRSLLSGKFELREWVLSTGGLGVISKKSGLDRDGFTDEDLRHQLVERILDFYWTLRSAVEFQ